MAWASLPIAILPSGTSTAAVIPACVAYAAAEAEVLPVDAQTTAFAPCSTAFEIAIVMPRSLKEPVGFMPSNFTKTRAPVRGESAGASMSGVPPPPSGTIGGAARAARPAAHSRSTPLHWWDTGTAVVIASLAFDAQHSGDRCDLGRLAQGRHDGRQRRFR